MVIFCLVCCLVPFPLLFGFWVTSFSIACHLNLPCLESPSFGFEFPTANSGGVVVGTQKPDCASWVCLPVLLSFIGTFTFWFSLCLSHTYT